MTTETVPTEGPIVVGGLRLYAQRRPGSTSPPLLLIHGLGGSLTSWGALLAQLPDRDILMVDSPGAGRSAVPLLPMRLWTIADYVAGAARALGVDRADVLGFSHGGLVAQELARRHPALVRRLIVVGTNMGIGSKPARWNVNRALLSTKRYRDRATAERDFPILAGGHTARDPAVLAAVLDARAAHAPPSRGYRYQQWAVIGWSSRRWLAQLRVPTLVLHGEADPAVPVANARMLAARIPDAHLEVVPGAGHMLLFDESEKAAAIIERFLSG